MQALAEAEAGLLSGRSEGALEPPARRDSAADLHLQGQQLSSIPGIAHASWCARLVQQVEGAHDHVYRACLTLTS